MLRRSPEALTLRQAPQDGNPGAAERPTEQATIAARLAPSRSLGFARCYNSR